MKPRPIQDLPRSVRERLVALSHRRGEEANLVLARFAAERLLYRLSQTPHGSRFVLKGAMLFAAWQGYPHRPTRDLDLLGFGALSPEQLAQVFMDACRAPVEADGLRFAPESVNVTEIREGTEYGGLRVRLIGFLGTARLPVQVDVGMGDAVVPEPKTIDYPTLLAFPAPRIKAYPLEAVVAEKLHAMVTLGMSNSRMKDFFDVATIARSCAVEGGRLRAAVAATFARRGVELPSGEPLAFTEAFASAAEKERQWRAFLDRTHVADDPAGLAGVVGTIRGFLTPVVGAVRAGGPFEMTWPPGGPWR